MIEPPTAGPADLPQAPPASIAKTQEVSPNEAWAAAEKKADAFEAAQKAGMEAALAAQDADPGAETPPDAGQAEPAEKTPSKAVEGKKPAPETKAAPSAEPVRGSDREQLETLAAKLGYKLDERAVVPADRANFRAEKRKHKAALAQQQQALQQQAGNFEALTKAQTAFNAKDYWGGLKALGVDPNAINRAAAEQLDPALAEARKTSEEVAQLKAERAQILAQQAQAQANHRYAQECHSHRQELAADWAKSDDPAVQRLAADPALVEQARRHAEHVYRQDGENISSMEAAQAVLPRAREAYQKLAAIFGEQAPDTQPANGSPATATPEGSPAATPQGSRTSAPRRATQAPKVVSQRNAAAEVLPPEPVKLSDAQWARKWTQKMRESEPMHGK